jgi:hypothetical protein
LPFSGDPSRLRGHMTLARREQVLACPQSPVGEDFWRPKGPHEGSSRSAYS